MKEDLAIARNSLMALHAENLALRQHSHAAQSDTTSNHSSSNINNIHDRIDPEMAEALADEKKKRIEMEKELDLQVYIRVERNCMQKIIFVSF